MFGSLLESLGVESSAAAAAAEDWVEGTPLQEGLLVSGIPDSKSYRGELVGVEDTGSIFANAAYVLTITSSQIVLLSPSLFSSKSWISSEGGHVDQVLPFSMPALPESLSASLGGAVDNLQKLKKSTVVKAWDIKMLEKLKFKRADPGLLSLFFKDGEGLNILIPDIMAAVDYIKLQMKNQYGIEGLHKSKQEINAESFVTKTSALLKEFDTNPSFELVKAIMALFREATERFSLLNSSNGPEKDQSRYLSIVKDIQTFLNRSDVVKLLEDQAAAAKQSETKNNNMPSPAVHVQAINASESVKTGSNKGVEDSLMTKMGEAVLPQDKDDEITNSSESESTKTDKSNEIESELNDINAQFDALMESFAGDGDGDDNTGTEEELKIENDEEKAEEDFSIEDFDSLMEQFSIK